jgi:hypothetical protein
MRAGLVATSTICLALILAVALTGDGDAIDPQNVQDAVTTPAGALAGSQTIGQTLVFHYPRLHAIELRWIVSPDVKYAGTGRMVLHLRRAQDSVDLATASIALGDIRNDGFAKFSFPPIPDSQEQSFYFFVDASQANIPRGYVSLWASADDVYPAGQMYINGAAARGDLAFRAYYEPDVALALQALRDELMRYAPATFAAVGIALVVGLAFLLLFQNASARHMVETIALASGLGLGALSALAFLLLILRAPAGWLTAGVAAALLAVLLVSVRQLSPPRSLPRARQPGMIFWWLAACALLSMAVVFLQIRDTPVPLWKDSPTHAQTIAMILAQGHLPTDAFYHFGFHSIAALLVQLSGASIPAAMLILGQLLIVQIGLSMFLLTRRLTGSDIAALVGAVCVWFLSPTPAYWITWGRYPLLLGAALLPLALVFAMDFIDAPRAAGALLAALMFGGLAFAHARLAVCYLVFVALYLAHRIWRDHRAVRAQVLFALALAPMALLLAMRAVAQWTGWQARLPAAADLVDLSTAIAISLTHHGPLLLALAAIGLVAALWRRRRGAWLVVVWFSALAGVSLIGGEFLPLPYVVLLGFVPVSIFVGDGMDFLYTQMAGRARQATVMWSVTLLIVSALGARDMISVINPATILFTRADQEAMTWIDGHTPRAARVLVNSDVWFGSGFSPSDGGVWIPFLTGRPIDYVTSPTVTERADIAVLARWIDAHHIDFVYLSEKAGVLRRADFACVPDRYARVYDQDGVTIFQVQPSAPTRLAPRAGCIDYLR